MFGGAGAASHAGHFSSESNIGGHKVACRFNRIHASLSSSSISRLASEQLLAAQSELRSRLSNSSSSAKLNQSVLVAGACSCATELDANGVSIKPNDSTGGQFKSEQFNLFSATFCLDSLAKRDVLLACTIKREPLEHLSASLPISAEGRVSPVGDSLLAGERTRKNSAEGDKESCRKAQVSCGGGKSSLSKLRACRSLISLNGRHGKSKRRAHIPSSMLFLAAHNQQQRNESKGCIEEEVDLFSYLPQGGASGALESSAARRQQQQQEQLSEDWTSAGGVMLAEGEKAALIGDLMARCNNGTRAEQRRPRTRKEEKEEKVEWPSSSLEAVQLASLDCGRPRRCESLVAKCLPLRRCTLDAARHRDKEQLGESVLGGPQKRTSLGGGQIVLLEFDCQDEQLEFVRTFVEDSLPSASIPELVLGRMQHCQERSAFWERQLKVANESLRRDFELLRSQLDSLARRQQSAANEQQLNNNGHSTTAIKLAQRRLAQASSSQANSQSSQANSLAQPQEPHMQETSHQVTTMSSSSGSSSGVSSAEESRRPAKSSARSSSKSSAAPEDEEQLGAGLESVAERGGAGNRLLRLVQRMLPGRPALVARGCGPLETVCRAGEECRLASGATGEAERAATGGKCGPGELAAVDALQQRRLMAELNGRLLSSGAHSSRRTGDQEQAERAQEQPTQREQRHEEKEDEEAQSGRQFYMARGQLDLSPNLNLEPKLKQSQPLNAQKVHRRLLGLHRRCEGDLERHLAALEGNRRGGALTHNTLHSAPPVAQGGRAELRADTETGDCLGKGPAADEEEADRREADHRAAHQEEEEEEEECKLGKQVDTGEEFSANEEGSAVWQTVEVGESSGRESSIRSNSLHLYESVERLNEQLAEQPSGEQSQPGKTQTSKIQTSKTSKTQTNETQTSGRRGPKSGSGRGFCGEQSGQSGANSVCSLGCSSGADSSQLCAPVQKGDQERAAKSKPAGDKRVGSWTKGRKTGRSWRHKLSVAERRLCGSVGEGAAAKARWDQLSGRVWAREEQRKEQEEVAVQLEGAHSARPWQQLEGLEPVSIEACEQAEQQAGQLHSLEPDEWPAGSASLASNRLRLDGDAEQQIYVNLRPIEQETQWSDGEAEAAVAARQWSRSTPELAEESGPASLGGRRLAHSAGRMERKLAKLRGRHRAAHKCPPASVQRADLEECPHLERRQLNGLRSGPGSLLLLDETRGGSSSPLEEEEVHEHQLRSLGWDPVGELCRAGLVAAPSLPPAPRELPAETPQGHACALDCRRLAGRPFHSLGVLGCPFGSLADVAELRASREQSLEPAATREAALSLASLASESSNGSSNSTWSSSSLSSVLSSGRRAASPERNRRTPETSSRRTHKCTAQHDHPASRQAKQDARLHCGHD